MSDIVFVVPQTKAALNEEFNGTLLLATILKQKQLDVDIYRFYEADKSNGFDCFIKETSNNILHKMPKIVSFYCRSDCFLADIMIAKTIKDVSPATYIVFGGPQADVSAFDTLNEISWVDFCCRGEGETTVYPLFSALLNGTDYTMVDGLTYKSKDGTIIENPVAQLITDLDSLPYIDYSLVPKECIEYTVTNKLNAKFDIGRGCPFKCAYCSTSTFWQRKFRIKSADRIISEMKKVNELFGITIFSFSHDLFTANKKRVLEFTDTLSKTNSNFKWKCSSRVDTIDEETIIAMANSGLSNIYLGIESGSERMQVLMNKKLRIDDVVNTVSLLTQHNVKVTASFMYGIPEENEEDLEQTLQLVYALYKMGVEKFQFHLCAIPQGTPYYYKYYDNLTLSIKPQDFAGNFGVEECWDFIHDHINLFSFYYEYKSEFRDKFANLNKYAMSTIRIYDKLCALLPTEHQNIKLTELLLEIMDIYSENLNGISIFGAALEYINRHSL